MQAAESIRFAGDISVDKIEIITMTGFGQDITNQVRVIEIFEDIYSPFISGVIVLKETIDYINLFPLIGEEFINISIHTPSMPQKIDQQFAIYKIANRMKTNDRNQLYEIFFTSKETLVDVNKKVSKSYNGKASDIVNEIVKDKINGLESTKNLILEESINNIKYISNYWSPVKNINYISELAKNFGNFPSYLFFENRNGLNFSSLQTMYTRDSIQSFTDDSYFRDFTFAGNTVRNVEEEYKRIIDIEVPVLYDYIDRAAGGMYSSRKFTYDIVTKKYTLDNFDIFDDTLPRLNPHAPVSSRVIRKPSQLHVTIPKHYNLFNNYVNASNSGSSQLRRSLLKQAETNKIIITVPGRMDYTVGSKVYLNLNKFATISEVDNDFQNKIFSGNYLIASINHSIDKEKHSCVMELIKDSYIIDLEKGLS